MPIVLNAETKSYSYPGLDITRMNFSSEGMPWGKRLIRTLKAIKSEYILFFLEDFWLDAPVDNEYFEYIFSEFKKNEDVAVIYFQPTPRPGNVDDGRFERFERRYQKGAYRMNCQAALWRKDKLIESLQPHESAWEWENYGTIRSYKRTYSVYAIKEDAPPVFSYEVDQGGVIHRGKWNADAVKPLADKHGLKIDYSIRGFETWPLEKRKDSYLTRFKRQANRRLRYIKYKYFD